MAKKPSDRHSEPGIEVAPRRQKDIIERELVRDARISLRALGAAVRLLSNAPGFRMTSLDLSRERKKGAGRNGEGRDAVRNALSELETIGYLQRDWVRLGNGQCVTRMIITDALPTPENQASAPAPTPENQAPAPMPENPAPAPTPEKPATGFPAVGGSGAKSSKSSNRNISKKTTTTTASLDWSYLADFDDEDQVVVVGLIYELDPELQQDLLDELAGARRTKGVIRTSWRGWFRSTVKNAIDGDFQLNHGLEIARDRAKRAQEAADREAAKVVAAEAAKRKSEGQARLDELDDSQVLEFLLATTDRERSEIENWLRSCRPDGPVAADARLAISRKK